jgi:uncharacterized membrane protein YjgN (DUF898 family)
MSDQNDTASAGSVRLEQRLSPASFVGLSFKNGFLNIVTLTLYRFWGRTEVRRRIWAATYLNDEPLEYTGRGMELFKGFLFALLVVGLPFLIAGFGAQLLGSAGLLLFIPLYLLLFFLLGFGVFTAFRYLASRTVWRGVRFGLEGSPVRYGRDYLGYLLLTAVTFGWFAPAMQRRMAGRLWGGLRFGDRKFSFDIDAARKEGVYGPYAIAFLGSFVAYILLAFVGVAAMAGSGIANDMKPGAVPPLGFIAGIYVFLAVYLVITSTLFAGYQAAMLRSIAAGVSFGDLRFKLDAKWLPMAGLTLGNLALLAVTLGFLMPLVQARTSKFLLDRLIISGAADLEAISQSAVAAPRTGEGLADAFGSAVI